MAKKTVQTTVRLQENSLRALKFVAADQDVSVNKLINDFILQGLQQCRISVPTDLLNLEQH